MRKHYTKIKSSIFYGLPRATLLMCANAFKPYPLCFDVLRFLLFIRSTTAQLVQDQEMQDIAFAMAATDDDMNFEMSEMPTFSLGLDLFGDDTEQQPVIKSDHDQTNRGSLKNDSCALTDPPFASKQNIPQQHNCTQESKFTKVVPSQKSSESNTRVFNFKPSTAATVKPFNKGIQNSTTKPHNMGDINTSVGTKGCSDGRLIKSTVENNTAYTTTITGKDKCHTSLDANDSRRNVINTTSTPNSTSKNIPRAFVSVSNNLVH